MDNFKQNQKINQVKDNTLMVGVDIGSTKHFARAFDWRGMELGKLCIFSNSREGFNTFSVWMQRIKAKCSKSDVMDGDVCGSVK